MSATVSESAVSSLPYATAVPRQSARVWAGIGIVFGAVCLVLLGGCFLIGVLMLVGSSAMMMNTGSSTMPVLTTPQYVLMAVLYVMAFLSFVGAAALFFVGVRGLLRIIGV